MRNLGLIILTIAVIVRVGFYCAKECPGKADTVDFQPMLLIKLRKHLVALTHKFTTDTYANLILGMTIGVEDIKNDKRFYDKLIQLGVVHVVVVSGYNVSVVLNSISLFFRSKFSRTAKFMTFGTLAFYVILCGAEAPVIRAALMGYIGFLGKSYGRSIPALKLLYFACLVMLLMAPANIKSLSFWLSSSATLGLILFEPVFSSFIKIGDLATTLAAQVVVWPIISAFFGRISLLSPIYNLLLIWTVSPITILGFIFTFCTLVWSPFAKIAYLVLHPFIFYFAESTRFISIFDKSNLDFKLNFLEMAIYYSCLLLLWVLWQKRHAGDK